MIPKALSAASDLHLNPLPKITPNSTKAIGHFVVIFKLAFMQKLLIASGNAHKVNEIREILKDLPLEVLSLKDIDNTVAEPEENGDTFEANAKIKALAYKEIFDGWILSDDSGIVVPDLDGEPGIYSARYSGPDATDQSNRKKLQEKVKGEGRALKAYFVCVLCLHRPDQETLFFPAQWHGSVVDEDHGENGFGYDPMFFPEGFEITAAQMSEEQKNTLSHRSQALEVFKSFAQSALSK